MSTQSITSNLANSESIGKSKPEHSTNFFLAFDHRQEFARSLDGLGIPNGEASLTKAVIESKQLIAEACQKIRNGSEDLSANFGVLVDEQYGAKAAQMLKESGVSITMPVEVADTNVFDFCYGKEFGDHIRAFDPEFVKALVRFNIDGDSEVNAVQLKRLKVLQDWIERNDCKLMLELVVPPTPAQQTECKSKQIDFIRNMRPGLALRGMETFLEYGIQPHIWKIEGVDDHTDAHRLGTLAENPGGRRSAKCIVLSSGQSDQRVKHWLSVAAATNGYRGFAIGRSIWKEPVRDHIAGHLSRSEASSIIVEKFSEYVSLFESTRAKLGRT